MKIAVVCFITIWGTACITCGVWYLEQVCGKFEWQWEIPPWTAAIALGVLLAIFTSCSSLTVPGPVTLDEKACPKDVLFPPEYTAERLRGMGVPNHSFLAIQQAHAKCHNAERDAIEANQKRVTELGQRVRPAAWQTFLDYSAGIFWVLVGVGAAVASHGATLVFWL